MFRLTKLGPLLGLSMASWLGLTCVIILTSPDSLVVRALFFVLLYLGLASGLAVIVYAVGPGLSASRGARADSGRYVVQGFIWAIFPVAVIAVNAAGAMSVPSALLLLVTVVLLSILVSTRR